MPPADISQINIEDIEARPFRARTFVEQQLRGQSDHLPQRWWFASTAIPLIAATIGPFSNVLSIVSLVSPWRFTLPNNGIPDGTGRGSDDAAIGIQDPAWELIPNSISIFCGFVGHLFLLLNFTRRVRYIVALPLSILFWLLSAIILIAVEIAMAIHVPPIPPSQTYSQGFWYSVLASLLYIIGSGILGINMIGYFRGHYPQTFELDDDQRTLILQTMSFFFWLAGASGVFCALEGFTYADSLYYAQVSVLTIGFGDFAPKTDAGRAFLFVFQFVGIIFLALVITSLTRFVANISSDKIMKRHQVKKRASTFGRIVSSEQELREKLGLAPRSGSSAAADQDGDDDDDDQKQQEHEILDPAEYPRRSSVMQLGRLKIVGKTVTFDEKNEDNKPANANANAHIDKRRLRHRRQQKLLLLSRERDRFEAVRQIQSELQTWKQSWAAGTAILSFLLLWTVGALVFLFTESRISDLRYFDCLYFCFVALLTIGYGDLSPKSNLGKPFFVVWSIVAVPIVTVLIQAMSQTVVRLVNKGTFRLADWTVMPRKGLFKSFLGRRRKDLGMRWIETRRGQEEKGKAPQVDGGVFGQGRWFDEIDPEVAPEDVLSPPTNEGPSGSSGGGDGGGGGLAAARAGFAQRLCEVVKEVAVDLRTCPERRYSFEEWEKFRKLIQFTQGARAGEGEQQQGEITGWDWIGEDSPLLANVGEPQWVLERLVESLGRWVSMQERAKYWDDVFDVMNAGGRQSSNFDTECSAKAKETWVHWEGAR